MRIITLLAFLFGHLVVSSQNQGNIWYFGNHAGLDFNSGSPVSISGGQVYFPDGIHSEGSASICDSSGSLLFYTNGRTVWDKNHMIMPNGNGLMGNWSSTQAALILPEPGSSRYYYIFTTDGFYNSNMDKGLRYSKVDMCLNSGFGQVIFGSKNVLVLDTVAEKLTAVRHSNGTDYWVITHKYYSDAFYAFHLSATGIIDTVISHIGSFHPTGSQYPHAAIGQLKASPDGHKLAIANGNTNNAIAEYFDFDPATGSVSNCVNVQWDTLNQFYGISFSPDNSKLYFACNFYANGIYQFDLNAGGGDPDSVRASRTLITNYGLAFFALQLGPDGKIYGTYTPSASNSFLGVIDNPNQPGTACTFIDSAVSLNGQPASHGLPNFLDSYNYLTAKPDCPTGLPDESESVPATIFPSPVSSKATVQLSRPAVDATLKLYNALGECLMEITNLSGSYIDFDVSSLPPGNYFMLILEEGIPLVSQQLVIVE